MRSPAILAIATEFRRIDERAASYTKAESTLDDIADGDEVYRGILATIVQRAFIMGYNAAILDVCERADVKEERDAQGE